MLRDDLEIMTGHIVNGSVTPLIYLLVKDGKDPYKLLEDAGKERRKPIDTDCGTNILSGPNPVGRISLEEWINSR